MPMIDKSNKNSLPMDSIEQILDRKFALCRRLLRRALKDLANSDEAIRFDAAQFFALHNHLDLCLFLNLDDIEIKRRAIECIKEEGVRRQRMVNDLVLDFNDSKKIKLN